MEKDAVSSWMHAILKNVSFSAKTYSNVIARYGPRESLIAWSRTQLDAWAESCCASWYCTGVMFISDGAKSVGRCLPFCGHDSTPLELLASRYGLDLRYPRKDDVGGIAISIAIVISLRS